jgi:hypothetical protein
MCKWLLFASVYCFALVLILCVEPFRTKRWGPTREAFKRAGIFAFSLQLVLAICSFPLGFVLDFVDRLSDQWRLRAIEIWILSLTGVDALILLFALRRWPWLIVLPALTLADSAYAIVSLLIAWRSVQSPARSLLLDTLRYFQVIVVFAGIYFCVQNMPNSRAFCDAKGNPVEMTPPRAFYFSALTAATVGYGDIAPCLDSSLRFILRPHTLIPLEMFCILLIVAIEIPRIIGANGNGGM